MHPEEGLGWDIVREAKKLYHYSALFELASF